MTKRPNEKNERIKRQFLDYRKHARQLSKKTLDPEIAALERFDVWNGRKDFARFHIEWAMGFRAHLEQAKGATRKPLSKSTMRAIMATLREFVLWLSQQNGFRSRVRASDADYFKLSRRDEAEARARTPSTQHQTSQTGAGVDASRHATGLAGQSGVRASVPDRNSCRGSNVSADQAREPCKAIRGPEPARSGHAIWQED